MTRGMTTQGRDNTRLGLPNTERTIKPIEGRWAVGEGASCLTVTTHILPNDILDEKMIAGPHPGHPLAPSGWAGGATV